MLTMRKESEATPERCHKCPANPAKPAHPCPFQADVNNDPDFRCHCCEECEQVCADEI